MNVMIADDEYIIRSGVTAAIKRISGEYNIVNTSSDGDEAYEAANRLRPDIIILDINMPKCNGLDFIDRLRLIHDYQPQIIILTGFREFDYIQKAMDMGATAFLLKPVKRDALEEGLKKCKANILKMRQIDNIVSSYAAEMPTFKNSFLLRLLTGESLPEEEISVKFERYAIQEKKFFATAHIKAVGFNHQLIIDEFTYEGQLSVHFCSINSTDTCILIFTDTPDNSLLYKHFTELSEKIQKKTGSGLKIGISRFYSGGNYYSTAYYESLETASLSDSSSFIKFYDTVPAASVMKKEIQDAINIISRDYSKPLTVDKVAEELRISPSHLMHSFKQETGKTFNTYLTEYRMNIAISMLESKNYKIYEIADHLGYKSSKHFSRLFKTMTGHSPREYTSDDT